MRISIWLAVLIVCFPALATCGHCATEARYVGSEQTSISFKLMNPRVISRGQTVNDASGVLVYDYIIEAEAVPGSGGGTARAIFRVKLSSFRPSHDMPGQLAGRWYLRGVWTIASILPGRSSSEKRHQSVRYRGMLESTTDFDPLSRSGSLSAGFKVPTSLSEAGWLSGSGSFVGDSSFKGTITLDIDKPIQAEAVKNKEVGHE